VYNHAGGHAYGSAYSGPIGSILTPGLLGSRLAGTLPFASTLCGACAEICPVKVPIPEILLHLRRLAVEGDESEAAAAPPALGVVASAGAQVLSRSWLYECVSQVIRRLQRPLQRGDWLPALPPPLDRWTVVRPFPAFRADFRAWWRGRTPEGRRRARERKGAALLAGLGVILWLAFHWDRRRGKK
jgi:L-lactate dehydrogenase complex protein LldF